MNLLFNKLGYDAYIVLSSCKLSSIGVWIKSTLKGWTITL